jgi:putative membrane-bound dehydrogenase-like protein
MNYPTLLSSVCFLGFAALGLGGEAAAAEAVPPIDLPPGYEAVVAAAPPLVRHPIMVSLGGPGQIFVGDAAGTNLNKAGLERELPNRLVLLTDANGDGTYDRASVFADRMTFPQGGVWLEGSFYVASPPGIWRLTDADGDGVAERREMIVGGFEYTGNAADVHGPFLHPNGRLYWCHGRKGHDVRQKDGTVVHSGLASGIWSCRPDGAEVRWHALACADNPTEIDFTPEGEIFGTVNLYYSNPRGDTIVHWLRGGVYERPDQLAAIASLPRTLESMPVAHNFGHVAVAGCAFYRSGALDPAWRGNLFVAHFNTQRVTRMETAAAGASLTFREHEFLKLRDPDAHLTDLIEDRDGTLLVINTGGWFQIGCPSSLMSKQDAPGAIYRIRRADRALAAGPRWEAATEPVWALARRSDEESLRSLENLLKSDQALLARAAGNALAGRADPRSVPALIGALGHGDPGVQLAAAHALGEMPVLSPETVGSLLSRLEGDLDRSVEHQILFALARPGHAGELARTLGLSRNAAQRRRILGILDPLPGSPLSAAEVLPLLNEPDNALAKVAAVVVSRHRDWIPAATELFAGWLRAGEVAEEQRVRLETALSPWGSEPSVRAFVASLAEDPDPGRQRIAWQLLTVAPGAGAGAGGRVGRALAQALGRAEAAGLPLLLAAASNSEGPGLRAALNRLAEDAARPLGLRLKALAASIKSGSPLPTEAGQLLLRVLREEKAPAPRLEAARCLARVRLSREQMLGLASVMASLSPLELRLTSAVIPSAPDEEVGRAFAQAVALSPALATFQESEIRTLFSRWAASCLAILNSALREVTAEDDARRAKLERLPALVSVKGRASEGRKVFESGRGACNACHRIGEVGNQVGPNLSAIGKIRTERDLLESILFPSATLARDFEARAVELTRGESLIGVISRNSPESVVLHDAAGEEHVLPRAQIASIQTLSTSLMPTGLDHALTEDELLDLVAYLRSRQ